jgi:plasmid stabilization system protein ParE
MVKAKRVIWPQKARKQLREAYEYIKLDSVQNAEKVRKEILSSTRQLTLTPKIYRSDKYKKDNDGNYRAYELHKYRISYHIGEEEITIVRVRHTSMDPLEY